MYVYWLHYLISWYLDDNMDVNIDNNNNELYLEIKFFEEVYLPELRKQFSKDIISFQDGEHKCWKTRLGGDNYTLDTGSKENMVIVNQIEKKLAPQNSITGSHQL